MTTVYLFTNERGEVLESPALMLDPEARDTFGQPVLIRERSPQGDRVLYDASRVTVVTTAGDPPSAPTEPASEPVAGPAPVSEPPAPIITDAARNASQAPTERSTFTHQVMATAAVAASVQATHETLTAAGFTLPRTFFPVGTILADSGVAAFQDKKNAHASMPTVPEGTDRVIRQVVEEKRRNTEIRVGDLVMNPDGTVRRQGGEILFTTRAFQKFTTAIGIPSAGTYLSACEPELRAVNVNAWIGKNPDHKIMFRTRTSRISNGRREIFAVVSPDYACCDADKIAAILRDACSPWSDARVKAVYDADGGRVTFDVEWMTDIAPQHAVVGEVWRATCRVMGNDVGGGSIKGGGGVSMALCLNFTYADVAGYTFSLRHVGNDDRIQQKLRNNLRKTLDQMKPLLSRWNKSCETDVIVQAAKAASANGVAMPAERIPARLWLFGGILERELVPVVGRKPEALKKLMQWHDADKSSAVQVHDTSRASIVNAFTRYAHEEVSDPFVTDEIQKAASSLLWSDKPLPVYNPHDFPGYTD